MVGCGTPELLRRLFSGESIRLAITESFKTLDRENLLINFRKWLIQQLQTRPIEEGNRPPPIPNIFKQLPQPPTTLPTASHLQPAPLRPPCSKYPHRLYHPFKNSRGQERRREDRKDRSAEGRWRGEGRKQGLGWGWLVRALGSKARSEPFIIQLYYSEMWNSATPYLPYFYYGNPMPWCPFLAPPPYCPPETATVAAKPSVSPSLIACSPSSLDSEPLMEETTAKPRVEEKKRSLKKEKLLKKRVLMNLLQEREDNFEKKKQKKDRNLPSNIFRNFATFIHAHPRPQALLPTSPNSPSSLNLTTLVQKLKLFIGQNQTYIRPALIQSLWIGRDLSPEQARLFRILLKRFLQVELPMMVATMGKLKKMQKTAYLRLARKLYEQLRRQYFL